MPVFPNRPDYGGRIVVIGAPDHDIHLPFNMLPAESLVTEEAYFPTQMPEPWDLMGILFTSGTTGNPKGVLRPWAQSYVNAMGIWGSDHAR